MFSDSRRIMSSSPGIKTDRIIITSAESCASKSSRFSRSKCRMISSDLSGSMLLGPTPLSRNAPDPAAFLSRQLLGTRLRPSPSTLGLVRLLVSRLFDFADRDAGDVDSVANQIGRPALALWSSWHSYRFAPMVRLRIERPPLKSIFLFISPNMWHCMGERQANFSNHVNPEQIRNILPEGKISN